MAGTALRTTGQAMPHSGLLERSLKLKQSDSIFIMNISHVLLSIGLQSWLDNPGGMNSFSLQCSVHSGLASHPQLCFLMFSNLNFCPVQRNTKITKTEHRAAVPTTGPKTNAGRQSSLLPPQFPYLQKSLTYISPIAGHQPPAAKWSVDKNTNKSSLPEKIINRRRWIAG